MDKYKFPNLNFKNKRQNSELISKQNFLTVILVAIVKK